MKPRALTAILACVAMALLAVPAVASAKSAKFVVDPSGAQALGAEGVTPDVQPSDNLYISDEGQIIAEFEVKKSKGGTVVLGGSFVFTKGDTKVAIKKLTASGSKIRGSFGGKTYNLMKMRGVKESKKKITFEAATLSKDAAAELSDIFDTSAFSQGLRFFNSGKIPK